MKHLHKYFASLTVILTMAGCSTTRDLYLKDVESGQIYGPLNTSGMSDRHIPEGQYLALYSPKIIDSAHNVISTGTAMTVVLRNADSTNDIPRSEWSSAEATYLLSQDVNRFSQHEPGSIIGVEGEWGFRLIGKRADKIIVERLDSDYQWAPSLYPIDLVTHKYLTETIIDRFEFKQAPLAIVLDALRGHIPRIKNDPVLVINYVASPNRSSYPLTFNLSNISLIDAIYCVSDFSDLKYRISGNTITLIDNVQHAPPDGRREARRH